MPGNGPRGRGKVGEAMAVTRVESRVEIAAPVETVFAYASDWRTWDEWWVGVSGFRPTTAVTRGNGARYAYKARLAGVAVFHISRYAAETVPDAFAFPVLVPRSFDLIRSGGCAPDKILGKR